MAEEVRKKKRTALSNLVSNTYEKDTLSLTGVSGLVLTLGPLLLVGALILFYFFHVEEAGNVITIISSMVTIIGIGSGVIVGRKISADFGPNNRIILEGRQDERKRREALHDIRYAAPATDNGCQEDGADGDGRESEDDEAL